MLDKIKGIGPKTIEELNKLDITTTEHLLFYYPYRYNIYKPEKISNAKDNEEILITGYVESTPKVAFIKRNLNRMIFNLNTDNIVMKVSIFNRGFLKNNLNPGKQISVIGKYNKQKNLFTASDIKLNPITKQTIEPVYRLTNKIKKQKFNQIIKSALEKEKEITNYIPEDIMKKYNFINKSEAIKNIHIPNSTEDFKKSKLMLIYEELFIYMLKLSYLKKKQKEEKEENRRIYNKENIKKLIKELPFELTKDQKQVLTDLENDFDSKRRINRLILGDVGSGKTIMAFIALYTNYLSKRQGVMMAPTEILAKQHYTNLTNTLKGYNINSEILTSSTKQSERKRIVEELISGKIDILISTHSVLSDEINFKKLGLVITDEQHRFGVKQRKNLQKKGENTDIILMSATPIPRTVALTLYGDMDISFIKTKPKNNKKIITKIIKDTGIKDVLYDVLEEIKKGHQIYVVVPLTNENEDLDLEDINTIKEKFITAYGAKVPIGTIHGKLKSEEKEQIMKDFKENKIKILVSTTVIEVGIDVENATTIVIFNAERFGLATLHQLRGRVGRNNMQGRCYLISNYEIERLKVLEESNDGFYISEQDFKLRGTGDLFGVKQSGDMTFRLANINTDYKILLQAKEDAEKLLNKNLKEYPNQKQIIDSIKFID